MIPRTALFCVAMLGLSLDAMAAGEGATPVRLRAADGVTVFGDYYPAKQPKALILLFHQAGSNRAEYDAIAPRLVRAGYSALAIDQRSGGEKFGRGNQTVAALGRSTAYLDVEKDLEAALAWSHGEGRTAPVAVWGSSYSASLVFLLAARHPREVAAVLAFSPGEYLGAPDRVAKAAANVRVPVYVTSAQDTEEIDSARKILARVASPMKTQFLPKAGGVHGSSTLRADRNPTGAEANWQAVLAFLAGVRWGR